MISIALLAGQQLLSAPNVESSKVILDSYFQVIEDRLCLSDGSKYNYFSVAPRSDAVVVLAITEDNRVLLNQEYRHPTGKFLLTCPGGKIEEEEPIITAQRELLEETGFTAEEFVYLGSAYPYPGISCQKIYFVLAKRVSKVQEPNRDPGEIQETLLLTLEEVKRMIQNGTDIDGQLGTAFFLYSQLK